MNHKPKYLRIEDPEGWRIRCSCGRLTTTHLTRQQAEDDHLVHMREIEKTRARLAGPPTLKATHLYYSEQAVNSDLSAEEREQWQQLADEIEHRLPRGGPDPDQPTLL